jgi:transcriptional regulator with XRE-family HTH domain
MNQLRQKAEELRKQGYSYALINERLGVSRSTMSYWFKDKPYTPNQEVLDRIKHGTGVEGIRRHNQKVKEISNLRDMGKFELGELSKRDLWLLGIGLYIGEGSKTTEAIRIVNSDPAVVKLAIKWLKDVCGLKDENLTISLHLYPDSDVEACKTYWQGVTELSLG